MCLVGIGKDLVGGMSRGRTVKDPILFGRADEVMVGLVCAEAEINFLLTLYCWRVACRQALA